MKESVWHPEHWQQKLDELPLHKDADTGWLVMAARLEEQMPPGTLGRNNKLRPGSYFISGLILLLKVMMPVLGIAFIAYFLLPGSDVPKETRKDTTVKLKVTTRVSTSSNSISTGKEINNNTTPASPGEKARPFPALTGKSLETLNVANSKTAAGKSVTANTGNNTNRRKPELKLSAGRNKAVSVPEKSNRSLIYRQKIALNDAAQLLGNKIHTKVTRKKAITGFQLRSGSTARALYKSSEQSTAALVTTSANTTIPLTTTSAVILPGYLRFAYPVISRTMADSTAKNTINLQMAMILSAIDSETLKENVRNREALKKQLREKYRSFIYGGKLGIVAGSGMYLGAFSAVKLAPRWFLNPEVKLNTVRHISGTYTHPSYFRPDSIKPFTIADSRTLSILDLPVSLQYRASGKISLRGGPILSIAFNERSTNSKISILPDKRDTLNNGKQVNAALQTSILSGKTSLGIAAGLSLHLSRFQVEAMYLTSFTPHQISSSLGSYNKRYHNLQFGIGFELNKNKKTITDQKK